MTKKDNRDFKKSTKWWICDNTYVDSDVKVRDHFTEIYRGSAHRDRHINVKLNHKVPYFVFHNLEKCDSHLIMQEIGKFSLKIKAIPNGLEEYMSF